MPSLGIKGMALFLLLFIVYVCWPRPNPLWHERRLVSDEEESAKEEEADAGSHPKTREVAVVLPFGNVTQEVPLVRRSPGVGTPLAAILAVIFLLIQTATCCLCSYFGCSAAGTAWPRISQGYTAMVPKAEALLTDDEQQSRLTWEAALSLVLAWVCAGIGLVWVQLQGTAPPFWLLIILAAAASLRTGVLEFTLRPRFGQEPMGAWDILAFLLSKLDVQDAVGDGLAVAAAASLPMSAHQRFVDSFAHLPSLQWAVDTLGLAGVVALALAYATWLQAMLVILAGSGTKGGRSVMAEMAGMGALARGILVRGDEADSAARVFVLAITRVLAEAAPQALSQTSLLMAAGESILLQPVVLASVIMSLGVMLIQIEEAVRGACLIEKGMDALFFRLGAIGLVMLILGIATYCGLKLYMTESCVSRLWGISSGCIQ